MRNKKYIIPEISAQSIIASARRTDDGYSFYFDTTDPSKEYLVERTLQDDCPIFYQAMLVLGKNPDNSVLSDALMYGADPEDLVFYMRDDDEEESAIAGTRYETRKKYWQFALPAIQSAHADTGCFGGCTGSKENWISGFFGVNGCGILCVANYDSVRIDLYIGNNDVALNKRIFDTLFARKMEIETTLGVTLIWNRGDGQKSSKVSYEMKGIGITNESDWHRMSRFHAEWSKKIYDAVVDVIINTVQ